MAWHRAARLALAGALALGFTVTSAVAQVAGPTAGELARAFSSRDTVLRSALRGCTPGTIHGVEVRECHYCLTWVAIGFANQGGQRRSALEVRQGVGRIMFTRALSYENPSAQPMPGQPGVWIASRYQNGPSEYVRYPVPAALWNALQYTPITGLAANSEAAISDSVWGGRLSPAFRRSVRQDAALRAQLTSLAPTCGT